VGDLQDRDLAIAEKYTTEQQIADIELWKAQSTPDKRSSMFGFLKKTERRSSTTIYTTKDIEKLQKDIADTKLETALAKSELDTHYYRLRQLEKKCVALKLEIAQASALEDDLQASLAQLRHERRSSLEKLQQVSDFSTAAQKQASPRGQKKSLSPTVRSPRRTRMWA
jgi:chromosome segregation ATPase